MDDLALNHGGEGELKTQGQRWFLLVAGQVDLGPVVIRIRMKRQMLLRSWKTTLHFHSLCACNTVGLPDTKNCVRVHP